MFVVLWLCLPAPLISSISTLYLLVAQVDKDLRVMLLKKDAPKPKVVGVRVWPRAIPQANLGSLDALDKAKRSLAKAGWDNFLLSGNYVSGVALGKCVEYGYSFASDIASRLKKA